MIEVKKYKCNHQFRVDWNRYLEENQYEYKLADCTCIYVFGILVWKYLKSVEE